MKLITLLSLLLGLFSIASGSQNESILHLWYNYESWLETNYSEGKRALKSGASEQELVDLESKIGVKLPTGYRNWLKAHNGQNDFAAGLLVSNEFFATARILEEWQTMKTLLEAGKFNHPSESDPINAIKTDWWNNAWIPISGDGSGNLVCIDFSPDLKGHIGQVIDFDHETLHRTVLSNNFDSYIREYLKELKSGLYKYSSEYHAIVRLDEL